MSMGEVHIELSGGDLVLEDSLCTLTLEQRLYRLPVELDLRPSKRRAERLGILEIIKMLNKKKCWRKKIKKLTAIAFLWMLVSHRSFVGWQPFRRQVPPTSSFFPTTATVAPSEAAFLAQAKAAGQSNTFASPLFS